MKNLSKIFLIALVAVAFAACDSNPVDDNHDHEHRLTDIHRLELILNDAEVVVIEDNQFAGPVPDTTYVPAGGETALITLEATTEEGEEIHLDELGDEYFLDFSELNEEVAEVEQPEGERWTFRLRGRGEVGARTDLVLEFRHNPDNPHADLTTPSIPIEMVEGEGDQDH